MVMGKDETRKDAGGQAVAHAVDVAAYILRQRAPMTAMKLEKLVYYSFAWHLVWDEDELFPDRIEAWANGPVVPTLYRAHRGRFQLSGPEDLGVGDPDALTPDERESIDIVLDSYGGKSAHWLSELSHREDPWRDARDGANLGERQRGNVVIAPEAIHRYYDGLTGADSYEV